ncbi:MAG TPA: hypothetical protein VLB80_00590 [Candidatus Babeliales bacterium]|nr:hypothetical protein [Candidatus Babeliales bacterium]
MFSHKLITIFIYYGYERIIENISIYSETLLLTMDGGKDRPKMYKQFTDMFEPGGVVDIAFETDMNL